MNKSLLLACVFLVLTQTSASAENWVDGGKLQYDADSVYVDAASGLVHFTSCLQEKCSTGDPGQLTMDVRYDCDARAVSNYSPYENRWTDAVADSSELEAKLCAQKASLPRHQ